MRSEVRWRYGTCCNSSRSRENYYKLLRRLEPAQLGVREEHEEDTGIPHRQVLFRSGRSIAHLETATNFDLTLVPASNALYCKKCVPDFTPALHVYDGVKVLGVFKYDFSLGTSFSNDEVLPSMLKNLKVAVQNHFEGQKHNLNAEEREEVIRMTQGRFAKNKCIAVRATRTGYYVLKKYLAHARPPYHGARCRGI